MGILDWLKHPKGVDRHIADEVTAPAQEELATSQVRLSRLNRILDESTEAQSRLARMNRILLEARQAELAVQRRKE